MMRTFLLVGIAALAAISADAAYATHGAHTSTRVERRVIVVDGNQTEDAEVYRSADDRAPTEGDYRGRWNGQWNGTWETPEGQVYRGQYDGSYDAEEQGARHATRPLRRDSEGRIQHREPYRTSDDDLSRLCRRDDGVGGGIIGGVVGGVAGNRIAGRGNRTAGTLIGAGVGAIAGAVIDRAEDRRACDEYWRRTDSRRYETYGSGDRNYHGSGDRYEGGYYESGYSRGAYGYDYIPGPMTTIVIPGQPVIIEETETTYETVTVAARARVAPRRRVHRAAPRPRARCTCR